MVGSTQRVRVVSGTIISVMAGGRRSGRIGGNGGNGGGAGGAAKILICRIFIQEVALERKKKNRQHAEESPPYIHAYSYSLLSCNSTQYPFSGSAFQTPKATKRQDCAETCAVTMSRLSCDEENIPDAIRVS